MSATKIVQTKVTSQQLTEAQGGVNDYSQRRLWVKCPESYDADLIEAHDIVGDEAIRVVPDPDPEQA